MTGTLGEQRWNTRGGEQRRGVQPDGTTADDQHRCAHLGRNGPHPRSGGDERSSSTPLAPRGIFEWRRGSSCSQRADDSDFTLCLHRDSDRPDPSSDRSPCTRTHCESAPIVTCAKCANSHMTYTPSPISVLPGRGTSESRARMCKLVHPFTSCHPCCEQRDELLSPPPHETSPSSTPLRLPILAHLSPSAMMIRLPV